MIRSVKQKNSKVNLVKFGEVSYTIKNIVIFHMLYQNIKTKNFAAGQSTIVY